MSKSESKPEDTDKKAEKRARNIMRRVLTRVRSWVSLVGAKRESQSGYDLALSYAGEWHPFTWGVSLGVALGLSDPYPHAQQIILGIALSLMIYSFTGKKARMSELSTDVPKYVYRQIAKEPHYYGGGFVIGLGLTRLHGILSEVWMWAAQTGLV